VPRSHPVLTLKEGDEQQLRQWIAAYGTPQQVCLRSRIVLAAAAGQSDRAIVQDLGVNRNTVILWRARFQREGLDGLWEVAPGRGRKPLYRSEKIEAIVDATLRTKPKGMTHWSCRLMVEVRRSASPRLTTSGKVTTSNPIGQRHSSCRGMPSSWRS
jgi:transposase